MDLGPKTKAQHLADFLATKEQIRADLRKLPFPEKIKRIVQMQKLAKALTRDPHRSIYVWKCDW